MHLTPDDQHAIVEIILQKYPTTVAIYLYGSFATGDATVQSDVDIALLLPHEIKMPVEDRLALVQTLASKIQKEVDLVSLRSVSTVFQFVILQTPTLLYCANESARQQFESLIYSMYLRLNEERRLILQEIQKRGAIY